MKTVYMTATKEIGDRLIRDGSTVLSDAALLSVFLNTRKGKTPEEQAIAILNSVPLCTLYADSQSNHLLANGLSRRQLSQLLAGMELAKRSVEYQFKGKNVLSSPEHVRQYFSLHLAGSEHEVFTALFLDNRHRVIEYRELFHGTIDSAAVYPREVVKKCLSCNAAAVIFCHNHPSGVAEPSDTDVRLTRKLVDALALVDVRVLDHLIIGKGVSTSLAERGLM